MPDQRENLKYSMKPLAEADLVRLRSMTLVPWAVGKCERCGSTLANSPLPHLCDPWERRLSYGGCALGWGYAE